MPPKRAAARKAAAAIEEPTTNGVQPVAAKPAAKKAAPKGKAAATAPATKKAAAPKKTATTKAAPAKKAAPKAPAKKTAPATKATTASKRKASEEVEEDRVNGVKRSKSTSVEAAPKKARKVAQPKPKKPRVKGAILNSAPTDPLNVYVFGEGSSGELGLGSAKGQIEVKRPRLNPLLDADKVGVVSAAVGGMHTAVLTKDNKILTWGVNDQGALGRDTNWDGGLRDIDDDKSDSDSSDSGSDTGVNPLESTPTAVDMSGLPEDLVFTQVACTDSATFALTDEGQVYGWGTFRVSQTRFFLFNLF